MLAPLSRLLLDLHPALLLLLLLDFLLLLLARRATAATKGGRIRQHPANAGTGGRHPMGRRRSACGGQLCGSCGGVGSSPILLISF